MPDRHTTGTEGSWTCNAGVYLFIKEEKKTVRRKKTIMIGGQTSLKLSKEDISRSANTRFCSSRQKVHQQQAAGTLNLLRLMCCKVISNITCKRTIFAKNVPSKFAPAVLATRQQCTTA
jgi:hypothetical protein